MKINQNPDHKLHISSKKKNPDDKNQKDWIFTSTKTFDNQNPNKRNRELQAVLV